jgi:hypothetical protein
MALDIVLPDDDSIQDDGTLLLSERTVHEGGGHWRIHKADADDVWPSDLHAHNVQDQREKLDVYSGVVYSTVTKQAIYTLKPKQMRLIYNELSSCKEEAIKNKCTGDNKKKFNYLE